MNATRADREDLATLTAGAARIGLDLPDDRARRMLDYLALLREWNRAYNLTAVTDRRAQIVRHLLDSLAVSPWVPAAPTADIGSGAGLPGIPLAIADPGRELTLVDARAKKTRFLRHVVRTIGLENVTVVTARLENFRPQTGFDTVIARALAALPKLVALGGDLLTPDGRLLAMKGRDPGDEIDALPAGWKVRGRHRLEVPGLRAERHLIVIGKS